MLRFSQIEMANTSCSFKLFGLTWSNWDGILLGHKLEPFSGKIKVLIGQTNDALEMKLREKKMPQQSSI
jgi:hypothetical protein